MNKSSGNQRFPAKFRLKLKRDFDRVFQAGNVAADGNLVVHAVANQLTYSRIGISIGRRYGKAHERNRFKRWCREAYRLQRHEMAGGLDIVVRVKAHARPEFHAIERSLPTLVRKLAKRLLD